MWIMIAGPYRHGTNDPGQWEANLKYLNEVAYQVHLKGHFPVIGVNHALPVIQATGESSYQDLMMPFSLELANRCDAVLRVGGPSKGADQEVDSFRARGLPTYFEVNDIPTEE